MSDCRSLWDSSYPDISGVPGKPPNSQQADVAERFAFNWGAEADWTGSRHQTATPIAVHNDQFGSVAKSDGSDAFLSEARPATQVLDDPGPRYSTRPAVLKPPPGLAGGGIVRLAMGRHSVVTAHATCIRVWLVECLQGPDRKRQWPPGVRKAGWSRPITCQPLRVETGTPMCSWGTDRPPAAHSPEPLVGVSRYSGSMRVWARLLAYVARE